MQYIIICLISLIICSPALADTLQGKVVKVADGDTVTIVDGSGKKHRIRLGGIDAPEKDQPYGLESTKNLERLINGKRATINFSKHDRYGRIVGKILVEPPGDAFDPTPEK
jgi:endonuclease YncB( thermonuclease family)